MRWSTYIEKENIDMRDTTCLVDGLGQTYLYCIKDDIFLLLFNTVRQLQISPHFILQTNNIRFEWIYFQQYIKCKVLKGTMGIKFANM